MATSASKTTRPSSKESMVCRLCRQEHSDKSKLLPCKHAFCMECLKIKWQAPAVKSTVRCPACKAELKVPDGGLEQLPTISSDKAFSDMLKKFKHLKVSASQNPKQSSSSSSTGTQGTKQTSSSASSGTHGSKQTSSSSSSGSQGAKQTSSSTAQGAKQASSSGTRKDSRSPRQTGSSSPSEHKEEPDANKPRNVDKAGSAKKSKEPPHSSSASKSSATKRRRDPSESALPKCRLIHQFKAPLDLISDICAIKDGNSLAIVGDGGLVMCDSNGNQLGLIVEPIEFAFGVVERKGALYVSDYDTKRVFIQNAGTEKWRSSRIHFGCPGGMTVAKDGTIIVVDQEKKIIVKIDPTGTLLAILRLDTAGIEEVGWPEFVTVLSSGDIVITDCDKNCVYILTPGGVLKARSGKPGVAGSGKDQYHHPAGITTDPKGNLLVADMWNHRIVMLSPEGRFKGYLLTNDDDQLECPRGLCFMKNGNLVIVEQETGMVKCFSYIMKD